MKILRKVGAGLKNVAQKIGKGLQIAENVVSAADKASGGLLRSAAAAATGGMSENAIEAYNANKRTVQSSLKTAQRVGRIAERAGERGVVGSGAWTEAKRHVGGRGLDYMRQAEGLAAANPKVYQGLTKPLRPNFLNAA